MKESALLRTGLSRAISRLSIIFSLKSLLSVVKIEKSSKDGVASSCKIRGVFGSPLACCCQSLPFHNYPHKKQLSLEFHRSVY